MSANASLDPSAPGLERKTYPSRPGDGPAPRPSPLPVPDFRRILGCSDDRGSASHGTNFPRPQANPARFQFRRCWCGAVIGIPLREKVLCIPVRPWRQPSSIGNGASPPPSSGRGLGPASRRWVPRRMSGSCVQRTRLCQRCIGWATRPSTGHHRPARHTSRPFKECPDRGMHHQP